MSEQDSTIRDDEDVEAHGKKSRAKLATEEATEAEEERDDDVELHGSSKNIRSKS